MTTQSIENETFISCSEEETILRGKYFSPSLNAGDVIALYGNLGSGKTKFTQGICEGLKVEQHVSSPTFTLINEYDSLRGKIFHFDCYRLNSVKEIFHLGFEEYLEDNGICIIEWAERAKELLPATRFDIHFAYGNNEHERIISIEKKGQ